MPSAERSADHSSSAAIPTGTTAGPELLLGPMLRHVDRTSATIWVETDAPCTVEVCGRTSHTFTVHGHSYALVVIEGLEPGSTTSYEVALDGVRRWPLDGSTLPGSCGSSGSTLPGGGSALPDSESTLPGGSALPACCGPAAGQLTRRRPACAASALASLLVPMACFSPDHRRNAECIGSRSPRRSVSWISIALDRASAALDRHAA